MNCGRIWILWELYGQSGKFTNRSALFFNLHQESRVDWLVSFSQEKDWTLKTMNLTVPGLCTHPNIFMTRNNLNDVSGRDSLWYVTSNLCDLLMDKDPITQYETNFFECLCFSCKWKRFCSRERLEWPSPHDCTSSVWDELVFIPVIEPPAVRKVESKKFSAHPSTVNVFFHLVPPLLTQLPNLPTYPAHFAMAKPIPLLN
jgi:hypothetical protein